MEGRVTTHGDLTLLGSDRDRRVTRAKSGRELTPFMPGGNGGRDTLNAPAAAGCAVKLRDFPGPSTSVTATATCFGSLPLGGGSSLIVQVTCRLRSLSESGGGSKTIFRRLQEFAQAAHRNRPVHGRFAVRSLPPRRSPRPEGSSTGPPETWGSSRLSSWIATSSPWSLRSAVM